MSEEELKAVEKLKWYFKDSPTLDVTKNVNIVLNLIEKQQKEIENSISKDKIREIFEKINQCEIRTDGKVNAKNYMICGETERAYGWFINLDYIEKILLDRKGYNIGE